MGRSFNYPGAGLVSLGRRISVVQHGADTLAVTQLNRADWSGLLLRRQDAEAATYAVWETPGMPQEAVLVAGAGQCRCIWNEVAEGQWRIQSAAVSDSGEAAADPLTVWQSDALCLPPAAAVAADGSIWVAWCGRESGRFRLRVGVLRGGSWEVFPGPDCAGDAFRPSLACSGDRVLLAWDCYVGGTYRVGIAARTAGAWQSLAMLGDASERWLSPRLAAADTGIAHLCAVVMQEVDDRERGIADHFPFAVVARISSDAVTLLTDAGRADDPRVAADLREGLLASQAYLGYHGLRRNPALSVTADGRVRLLWEVRLEAEKTHIAGHLACREVHATGFGPCELIHDGGYGYAVPVRTAADALPIAYTCHAAEENEVLQTAVAGGGTPYVIDSRAWERWSPVIRTPPKKPTRRLVANERSYGMYWADTHCHGAYSPDAEGETDELIHFGRDLAGLDAICVIDNDFYPHKTLSEAEWQAHNEFCRHFTEAGKFVAFPGWEYTYHRQDLKPNFNHRCVIYRHPGGTLFRRTDPASATDYALFEQLKGRDVMCYPHHCTYQVIDPELDWNVEVTSSWRVCLEETGFTFEQLRQGARLGFLGSSDSHRSVPGLGGALTALYATELTPDALFDAYRHRRTLATQGFFMFADFRVGGAFIGEEASCAGDPDIEVDLETPEPMEFVEILRDGSPIVRFTPGSRVLQERVSDTGVPPGIHTYILRVKLVGDPGFNSPPGKLVGAHTSDSPYPHNLCKARGVFAWASPIWLEIQR